MTVYRFRRLSADSAEIWPSLGSSQTLDTYPANTPGRFPCGNRTGNPPGPRAGWPTGTPPPSVRGRRMVSRREAPSWKLSCNIFEDFDDEIIFWKCITSKIPILCNKTNKLENHFINQSKQTVHQKFTITQRQLLLPAQSCLLSLIVHALFSTHPSQFSLEILCYLVAEP